MHVHTHTHIYIYVCVCVYIYIYILISERNGLLIKYLRIDTPLYSIHLYTSYNISN